MTSIRNVWREAWSLLPDEVHTTLSSRDGEWWFPSKRTATNLFPTVFSADIDAEFALPGKLYKYRYIRTHSKVHDLDPTYPEEQQIARIRAAVDRQSGRLAAAAVWLPALEKASTGEQIGVVDKRGALLRLAWQQSSSDPAVSVDGEAHLAEVIAGIAATPYAGRMRRLLYADAAFLETLEAEGRRCRRPHKKPKDLARRIRRAYPVIRAFLDDEHLDHRNRPADGTAVPQTTWTAVTELDTGLWEWSTTSLGLSSTSPPAPAPLRRSEEVPEDPGTGRVASIESRRLDWSVERRLELVLSGDRAQRVDLPDEEALLIAEVRRAAAPLGIESPHGRALLAAGATLTMMIADGKSVAGDEEDDSTASPADDTRVAQAVRTHFQKWRELADKRAKKAGLPSIASTLVQDPSRYYASTLWVRIHGHDVHGRADYDAVTARDLLTGVARSVTDRLDGRSSVTTGRPTSTPERDLSADEDNTVLIAQAAELACEKAGPGEWEAVCRVIMTADTATDGEIAHAREIWDRLCVAAGVKLIFDEFVAWFELHRPE